MKLLLLLLLPLISTTSWSQSLARVTADASSQLGILPRYEQFNSAEPLCDTCNGDKQLLADLGTRYLRAFFFFNGGVSPSPGVYNITTKANQFNKMLSGNDYRLILTVSHSSPYNRDTSYGNTTPAPPNNIPLYKTMVTDVIKQLKTQFPRLEYIQAWNEPNLLRDDMKKVVEFPLYAQIYRAFAEAVKSINDSLPVNAIPLKVGGPNITHYFKDSSYIYNLINYCDTAGLALDFLDYHDYSVRTTPAVMTQRLTAMRAALQAHGFNNTEVWMSEYGTVGGGNNLAPTTPELLNTSAFIAAADQYIADGGGDKPIHWTGRHEDNYIKSEFVEGKDGKVYPFYNVLKAEAIMKKTRIGVTSNQLNASGMGVGAVAALDSSGISMLVRNYQNTGSVSYNVQAAVSKLPPAMAGKQMKVEVFLVDSKHSNYRYDSTKDKLEKVQEYILPPALTYTASLKMETNAVALVVFTPLETTASFTSGNLAVLRYGDGWADTTRALPLFIDEYTTAGSLVKTFAWPTAPDSLNAAVVGSNFSASLGKGLLTLGPDKQYLTLTGFNAALGATGVTTYDSATGNKRTVGTMDANGGINTKISATTLGIEGGIRNGDDVWLYGTAVSGTGVYVQHVNTATPTAFTQLTTTPTSARSIGISNNQLFLCSYNLGSFRLASVGTGLPVTTGAAVTAVPGIGSPTGNSFRQFVFFNLDSAVAGDDLLYIADDGGTGVANGLIRKYSFNGTTWTARGTFTISGLTNNKVYALTGKLVDGLPVLYAITTTSLISITESAARTASISATQSLLATSASSQMEFRGITFTPETTLLARTIATTKESTTRPLIQSQNQPDQPTLTLVSLTESTLLARFQSKEATKAQLYITDFSGRIITTQSLQLTKGENNLPINISQLKPGPYIAVLQTTKKRYSSQFLK